MRDQQVRPCRKREGVDMGGYDLRLEPAPLSHTRGFEHTGLATGSQGCQSRVRATACDTAERLEVNTWSELLG